LRALYVESLPIPKMSDGITTYYDDVAEYVALCRKHAEDPSYGFTSDHIETINPYGAHADWLREHDKQHPTPISPALKTTIPEARHNPTGLHKKYIVQKANGDPVDDNAEYFVLRLDECGKDPQHTAACRKAVAAYAESISNHLPNLAGDIRLRWLDNTNEGKQVSEETKTANRVQAKDGSIEMTRLLIGDQIIRWKCAQDASQEKAPGSAANCWVDGYLHGLQYANSVLPKDELTK
jgi:hypothetical protein